MQGRLLTYLVLASIMLLMLGVETAPVFADDFSSTGFTARSPVIGTFGGVSSSTDFSSIGTGGQVSNGVSTSTDFEVRAGFLYLDSFAPQGGNWRWYDDEGSETPSVPLAAENVAPASIEDGNAMKLRLTFHESANIGSTGVKFRLQFATSSDFESPTYIAEQAACSGASKWCYVDGAGADNGVITTGVLSDSDSCAASTGQGCGTHNESGVTVSTFTQQKSAVTEYEFTIKPSGAAIGTAYFFRALLVSATTSVPLFSGASYPSLSLSSGTLTFSINGLPSATTTSGVTTNIDTTSTGVPFGALAFSGSSVAANRLTVSLNASAGYKIFAYERQQLSNQLAAAIPPVLGTNDSPLAWSTGCNSASTGCWGYHSSAPVLSAGDPARFAPEDTYAQFSSSPSEIAYSAVPVTGQSTDMVYRLSVNHEQEPGDYVTELVYIVTPVF